MGLIAWGWGFGAVTEIGDGWGEMGKVFLIFFGVLGKVWYFCGVRLLGRFVSAGAWHFSRRGAHCSVLIDGRAS